MIIIIILTFLTFLTLFQMKIQMMWKLHFLIDRNNETKTGQTIYRAA